MALGHELVPAKAVDLDWVAGLSEEKRVPLLAILTHTNFEDCLFFRMQLRFIFAALEDHPHTHVTYHDLAQLFNCNVGSIAYQVGRLKDHIQPIGRPRLLTPEAYLMISRLVTEAYTRREPITILYLIEQVQYFFDINVSQNTMAHILRRVPDVKMITGIPLDRSRVMADPHAIDAFYENIRPLIDGVPRAFIVNIDESGFADYPDSRRETVVVPSDYPNDTIPLPFDRNTKRATMVAAIAADGSALKPLIIVPRKTIEMELLLWGYDAQKVIFEYQENGFITIKLFEKWLSMVLLPYISACRARTGYQGRAVLLLDGCACHAIERLRGDLQTMGISLAPIPPHSSDQVQPLDLGVFGTVKRWSLAPISGAYSRQTAQAMRMFDAWQRATVPRVVVAAFRAAGFVPFLLDRQVYVKIDLAHATRIRHWTAAPHMEDVVSAAGLRRLRLPHDDA
jgi:hypothetical protein